MKIEASHHQPIKKKKMKRFLFVLMTCMAATAFAGISENEPVLIKKIGAWTTNSIFYPEKALKDKKEGTVYVSFKLTEDLLLSEIMIEEGVSKDLDQMAIEMVHDLQIDENQFIAGKKYILPIKFVIK